MNVFDRLYEQVILEKCLPPLEVIKKYKNDDNAFITFTKSVSPQTDRLSNVNKSGTKVGINPKSEYNTPIGVYFYPIKRYWENLEDENVHYQFEQPHLYIISPKNPEKIYRNSTYSSEDFQIDFEKLNEIFSNIDLDNLYNTTFEDFDPISPLDFLWILTKRLADHIHDKRNISSHPVIWTQILRRLCDGVVDDTGDGIIHPNEPVQGVMWTKAQFNTLEYIDRTCNNQRKNYKHIWQQGSHMDGDEAWDIAEMLAGNGKRIPIKVLQAMVYSDSRTAWDFADIVLKWENVPKFLKDTIINSNDGELKIPPNATFID